MSVFITSSPPSTIVEMFYGIQKFCEVYYKGGLLFLAL